MLEVISFGNPVQVYEFVLKKDIKREEKMLLTAQQGSSSSSCGAIHEVWQIPDESGVFGPLTSSVGGVVSVCIQVCASLLSLFHSYITLNKVKDSWSEPCVKGTTGSWGEGGKPCSSLLIPSSALTTFQRRVHLFALLYRTSVMHSQVLHLFLLLLTCSGMGSWPHVPRINYVYVQVEEIV